MGHESHEKRRARAIETRDPRVSRIRLLIWIAAVALLAAGRVAGAPAQTWALYSSLCVEPGSGDVAGYEITVLGLDRGLNGTPAQATFDWSEGGLMAPVAATDVMFDPASGALSFDAVAMDRPLAFRGRASRTEIRGTLHWGPARHAAAYDETIRLGRRWSAGRLPACVTRPVRSHASPPRGAG